MKEELIKTKFALPMGDDNIPLHDVEGAQIKG